MTWEGSANAEARRRWAEIEAAEIAAELAEDPDETAWLEAVIQAGPPEEE